MTDTDLSFIVISLVFTALTIFIAVMAVLINRRVVRHQKELSAAELNLLKATIEVQEEERKTIGANLHDDIGPLLSTVKMQINRFDRQGTSANSDQIKEVKSGLNSAIQRLRDISKQLVPSVLEEFGLKEALESELQTFCEAANIEHHIELLADYSFLSKEDRLAIYRIVKEAVNNAIKHSGTDKLRISDSQDSRHLFVYVKDYGKGFKDKMVKTGLGLRNMRARARAMDAEIDMTSPPEGGALVQLKIPIKQETK